SPLSRFALYIFFFSLSCYVVYRDLHSFPTRRSSDLKATNAETVNLLLKQQIQPHFLFNALNTLKSLIHKSPAVAEDYLLNLSDLDRKSTRLNSSHVKISYAVFCLKKKRTLHNERGLV